MSSPVPRILFENGDILAVDKPEGIVSIPGAASAGLPELLHGVVMGKLWPVHRLDKDVSGVIVFARNAEAHRRLNKEFDERAVKKTYLALTHGVIDKNRGLINKPIREFGSGRMGVDPERGKPSATEFKVMERFEAFTLVKVFPATGRRHQIRVHLYSIGHPVVGDTKYGDKSAQKMFPRLMLHALAIDFSLPSGEPISVEAPVPASFEEVLAGIRTCGRR